MIDHIDIPVSDSAHSRAVYDAPLPTMGASRVMDVAQERTGTGRAAGFGRNGKPGFWINNEGTVAPVLRAFRVDDRAVVYVLHGAGLAAGGRDSGAPGLREIYHPSHCGALLLDPDGHNVETVCHSPENPDA